MNEYPQIPHSIGASFREIPNAHIFDKLDGSNMRAMYSRKRKEWVKFGARHRLFDHTDQQFAAVIPLFLNTLGPQLAKICHDQKWESLIVFMEYWGPNSFAGYHEPSDPMRLDLIDANPHRHGLLGPQDFLKLFRGVPMARYLGQLNWTRGLVERIYNNDIPGVTFEGVIGKIGSGKEHNRVMAKAKTKLWLDKVKAKYTTEEAEKLINS